MPIIVFSWHPGRNRHNVHNEIISSKHAGGLHRRLHQEGRETLATVLRVERLPLAPDIGAGNHDALPHEEYWTSDQ